MKIAYVLNSTDVFGGATKSFCTLLYALVAKGVEPVVVLPDSKGVKKELDARGIKTLVLNYRPNTYPYSSTIKDYFLWIPRLIARRYVNMVAAKKLTRYIAGYDIVHTNVSVIDIGQRAAASLGIPHIYHFREYANYGSGTYYYPSMERFLSTVTYSVCITRGVQEFYQLQSSKKSLVVYNPISLTDAHPTWDACGEYYLFVGRLEESKGIEDLLIAYSKASTQLPLFVAGKSVNSNYEKSLNLLVRQLGVMEQVHFLGNRNDILSLMSKAKALIVPSFSEGFGRPVAEAMTQGCIVIGRNTTGIKEQFDVGKSFTGEEIGFRFSTIPELIKAIHEVEVLSKETYEDICKRAWKTVSHFYSHDVSVTMIFDFYISILKENEN